jgi:hypothetical protein
MLKRIFVLMAAIVAGTAGSVAADDKVDYEKQIQPIFIESCGKCHGAEKASGKMRLNTAAGLKEKWDADKKLIVPGDPEKSELYERLVLPADKRSRPSRSPKKRSS